MITYGGCSDVMEKRRSRGEEYGEERRKRDARNSGEREREREFTYRGTPLRRVALTFPLCRISFARRKSEVYSQSPDLYR